MNKLSILLAIALMAIIYSCGNGKNGSNEQKADSLVTETTKQTDNKQVPLNKPPKNAISDKDITSKILDTLGLDGEDPPIFKDIKSVGDEKIMVVGERNYEQDDNIYIVICDNSGNIKSKFVYKREASAEKLEGLRIMNNPYRVKDDVQVIGVVFDYMSSGYSSMSDDEVSLFTVENNKISMVLKHYMIKYSSSITEEYIKIVPDSTSKSDDGFYDLKLFKTEFELNEETGEKIDSTKEETVSVIKYIDGKYKNPY